MKEITAAPVSSEQKVLAQHSDMLKSEPSQDHIDDDSISHDSDNEPMIYETPKDYATSARQERDRLIASGVDPNAIVLQSELRKHISSRESESAADFTKRYVQTMKDMIGRGVLILNDMCTADVVAPEFTTAKGRVFDLGPGSGATKGEFRRFSWWFSGGLKAGEISEVPEEWVNFGKAR